MIVRLSPRRLSSLRWLRWLADLVFLASGFRVKTF